MSSRRRESLYQSCLAIPASVAGNISAAVKLYCPDSLLRGLGVVKKHKNTVLLELIYYKCSDMPPT